MIKEMKEIKKEIENVQKTDFKSLNYNYEELNKLRFKYDFLQLQLQGANMLSNIEAVINNEENEELRKNEITK